MKWNSLLYVLGLAIICTSIVLLGCKSKAKIATWHPPKINQLGVVPLPQSNRVAFAPIAGPQEVTQRLEAAINGTVPKSGTHLAVIYPADVPSNAIASDPPNGPFRTVSQQRDLNSQDKRPRELTPLDAARNRNAGLLVKGSIELVDVDLEKAAERPIGSRDPNNPGAALAAMQSLTNSSRQKDERLIVTWEAYDVRTVK